MIEYIEMIKILKDISNDIPIYIAGHLKPDQDSVCSSLALCEYLCGLNKKAKVLLLESDKNLLNWKNDFSKIVHSVTEERYNFIALDLNDKKRLGEFLPAFDNAYSETLSNPAFLYVSTKDVPSNWTISDNSVLASISWSRASKTTPLLNDFSSTL